MMKFTTPIDLNPYPFPIGYHTPTLVLGSCFAEHIGSYLQDRDLPVLVNPFGILYNPVSIAQTLDRLLNRSAYNRQELHLANGLFHSSDHHGKFSNPDPTAMVKELNQSLESASDFLQKTTHLLITLGTAWVFEDRQTSRVVANCHKRASSQFNHYRLSVDQITEQWLSLIDRLLSVNKTLKIIFTVSPIRHLGEGAHANQLSKSTLLLAIDTLSEKVGDQVVSYFPAYEIMMDELRDYRFYAPDMIHPSDVAVNYIQERFAETALDKEAQAVIRELNGLLPALEHRPLNPDRQAYLHFLEQQIVKLDRLQTKYPQLSFNGLREKFHKKTTC